MEHAKLPMDLGLQREPTVKNAREALNHANLRF